MVIFFDLITHPDVGLTPKSLSLYINWTPSTIIISAAANANNKFIQKYVSNRIQEDKPLL